MINDARDRLITTQSFLNLQSTIAPKPQTQYEKLMSEMTVEKMARLNLSYALIGYRCRTSNGKWYDSREQALAAEIAYLNSEVEE